MESVKTIEDIIQVAKEYLHEENLEFIRKAYNIAAKMHEGQLRKSGEAYVQHPLEVAYILAELHSGPSTIVAALVHDVLEDTEMSKEDMIAELGEDVANIVDGVTKISKLKYHTKDKVLAQNHQKMLLAMAKDIRVVMVKLVDRLHNMRTLEFHNNPDKQKRISKETLDLYAPLAHRLGMYRIKAELEDLSLKYFDTDFSTYRRQNFKDYTPNGAIFIAKPQAYLDQKHFFGAKSIAYIMDKYSSIDIDDRIDYELAKIIIRENNG